MEDEIGSMVCADARVADSHRADRALDIPDGAKALRE